MTFKARVYRCPADHGDRTEWRWDTDPPPRCQCGEPMMLVVDDVARAPGVIPDDIPGGVEIRHAICHPDGTPKRYYSYSEIRHAARQAGWTIDGETPKAPNCDGFVETRR